jgi:hypothetical protein
MFEDMGYGSTAEIGQQLFEIQFFVTGGTRAHKLQNKY